jgi:hypothetical protein
MSSRIAFQWRPRLDLGDGCTWRTCIIAADAGDLRVVSAGAANDRVPAGRTTAVICFSFPPEQARIAFSS